MVLKSREFFLKFHHLTALLLVALVLVALYLARDVDYWNYVVKQQINFNKEHTVNNFSSRCDFFSGRWIYDNVSYPLYEERRCSFMEDGFACEKYGRKEFKYRHWRWQPHHCDVPRFDSKALLEKLRGKKLIFVGDSLDRNQFISFLCLIEPSLPPSSNKTLLYNGNLLFLRDIEYNTTIGFYWSPFLVESNCDDPHNHRAINRTVRIESIENHAKHWNDADILIFDSYVWWLDPKLAILWGSFENPDRIYKKVELKPSSFAMALATWSDWLETNIDRTKTKLFFMGFSPYTHGYDRLRHCYDKSEPIFEEGVRSSLKQDMNSIVKSTLEKTATRGLKVEHLDISKMSEYRRDAHPSIYRLFTVPITEENRKNPATYADCLHWCLPGVPDIWNQILYAHIMD